MGLVLWISIHSHIVSAEMVILESIVKQTSVLLLLAKMVVDAKLSMVNPFANVPPEQLGQNVNKPFVKNLAKMEDNAYSWVENVFASV